MGGWRWRPGAASARRPQAAYRRADDVHALAVVVALVAAVGCNSKDPRARARAAARDFWPDAPAVTHPDEAASERATAASRGRPVTVTYAFAGKVYLDVERGVLDESRLYLHMEARTSGTTLRIGGTYRLTPLAP